MKKITIKEIALASLALAFLVPSLAMAGNLEPTAAPESAASAVYKTDDVYNRLQSGAFGAKRSGAFTEPSAGPADGVGKTLDEIMAVAPAPDSGGLMPDEAPKGKAFWGLNTVQNGGRWGRQIGTASPAPVPKSGQTLCYNDAGTVIACAGTGQDGAKLKGVALPNPRFTDNSNGTVTDNLTGLIWLKNANCTTVSQKTWTAAQTAVATLKGDGTMCTLSDGSVAGAWRMPNRRELFSLLNDQYYSPSLSNTAGTAKWTEGNPFLGVMSAGYWSSTTSVYSLASAWVVDLGNGSVYKYTDTIPNYVWPVRGGQ